MLFKLFQAQDCDIMVDMNKKVVQFWDVEFNLSASTVSSYTKPNTVFKYVKFKSIHSASVIRYIPNEMSSDCQEIPRLRKFLNKRKTYMRQH